MRIVVPLAGPDVVGPDSRLKPLTEVGGGPLLRVALMSRPWARGLDGSDYVFVLADHPSLRAFAADELAAWFPGCSIVFLGQLTRGAAMSALAGASAYRQLSEPLVVDLADILYHAPDESLSAFDSAPSVGATAMSFESANPIYSYLAFDSDGRFVRAAEKSVISRTASAGTYAFRSTPVYLRALAHAMEHEETQTHRNLFFVCPLLNGVAAQSLAVTHVPVTDVRDVKKVQ